MKKLTHVISKLDGKKSSFREALTELYKLAQKPDLFKGEVKTYTPYNEAASQKEQQPSEIRLVQQRAQDIIGKAVALHSEMMKLVWMQDEGNTKARADVVVDGVVVYKQLPVTNIMYKIKAFTDLRTLIAALPVPDPAIDWVEDKNADLLKSKEAIVTKRTQKVKKVIVKFAPTDKHPGQADTYDDDEAIGEYVRLAFSGCLPAKTKGELLSRLDKIIDALKAARESANMAVDVDDTVDSERLAMDWLLAPLSDVAKKAT